jgi:hypothetical protein
MEGQMLHKWQGIIGGNISTHVSRLLRAPYA